MPRKFAQGARQRHKHWVGPVVCCRVLPRMVHLCSTALQHSSPDMATQIQLWPHNYLTSYPVERVLAAHAPAAVPANCMPACSTVVGSTCPGHFCVLGEGVCSTTILHASWHCHTSHPAGETQYACSILGWRADRADHDRLLACPSCPACLTCQPSDPALQELVAGADIL